MDGIGMAILGYPSRSTYHNWCKQAREHGAFTLDVDVHQI
jgi:hypothetical protein